MCSSLLVLLVLLVGCGATPDALAGLPASMAPSSVAHRPQESAPATGDARTVVVVGDSVTAGTGPLDSARHPGAMSWVPAAEGLPLDFTGGWAVPGATSAQMQDGVTALSADVLLLMAGTNDVQAGIPWARTEEALTAISATVGADRTVLLAIPPLDGRPADGLAFNVHAAVLAQQRGWGFVDPWTGVSEDGRYLPGGSADGVHPTPETAAVAGRAIRDALLGGA